MPTRRTLPLRALAVCKGAKTPTRAGGSAAGRGGSGALLRKYSGIWARSVRIFGRVAQALKFSRGKKFLLKIPTGLGASLQKKIRGDFATEHSNDSNISARIFQASPGFFSGCRISRTLCSRCSILCTDAGSSARLKIFRSGSENFSQKCLSRLGGYFQENDSSEDGKTAHILRRGRAPLRGSGDKCSLSSEIAISRHEAD